MKSHKDLILSVLSGIFLALSWNGYLPAITLFFAFVPLLVLFENKALPLSKVFNYSFLSIFIYHVGTVWWLSKSSVFGFIVIISLNSIYLSLALTLSYQIRKLFGFIAGLFGFICIWLSFEYIHFWWELSWPFMNLGNWLGQIHTRIQWYEYTGILGGSLWILVVNCLIYSSIWNLRKKNFKLSFLAALISLFSLIAPSLISEKIYQEYRESTESLNFKLIQPNIDPYTQKYNIPLFEKQIKRQFHLAKDSLSIGIDCYLFPESSFPVYLNEDSMTENSFLKKLIDSLIVHDGQMVIGGLYSFKILDGDSLFYNTAFSVKSGGEYTTRHKSKLVIGVEKMPFQDYFGFLKKWNLDFGGFTNSLSIDSDPAVFTSSDSSYAIAPIICYESVYGQYLSRYIQEGASCIAVITNDAWWGDTPGYKQHLMHSKLRAIENRRNVVRAANTGISCIIDGRGSVVSHMEPFREASLTGKVYQNKLISFYSQNGDFIGKTAMVFTLMIILLLLYTILSQKRKFRT